MKSSKVSIKTRSTPASLTFKGQATEHTTLKWSFGKLANYESCCDQHHLATSRPVISCETASLLRRLSLRYLTANVAKTLNKNGVRLINKLITLAVLLFFKKSGKIIPVSSNYAKNYASTIYNSPGARFSKVPRGFRARKSWSFHML